MSVLFDVVLFVLYAPFLAMELISVLWFWFEVKMGWINRPFFY